MSKIKEAFKNGKAFIPFITGGDPDLETTKKLIIEMQNAGADIIEVGITFSDKIAEGQVIQKADLRSLEAGCTTDKLMDALIEIKDLIHIPLVFMTYINVIYKYGKKKFMDRCMKDIIIQNIINYGSQSHGITSVWIRIAGHFAKEIKS